jgi:hypothetical protein
MAGATDIVTERGEDGVARINDLPNGLGAHSVGSPRSSTAPAAGLPQQQRAPQRLRDHLLDDFAHFTATRLV